MFELFRRSLNAFGENCLANAMQVLLLDVAFVYKPRIIVIDLVLSRTFRLRARVINFGWKILARCSKTAISLSPCLRIQLEH